MNDFLRYNGELRVEAESGSYLVQLSQTELVEQENGELDRVYFFDGFKKDWFDGSEGFTEERWVEWFSRSRSFVIEVPDHPLLDDAIPRQGRDGGIPGLDAEEPDQWLELELGVLPLGIDAPYPVTIYPNLYAQGFRAELKQVAPVSGVMLDRLQRRTNSKDRFPDAQPEDIDDVLKRVRAINHVVVYDVGQGSCVGLCASNGSVLLYYDFGQGVLGNRKTVSAALTQFCFSNHAPIVLSHWDFDHWASANMTSASASLSQTWIVPHQMLGASHLAMAAKIIAAGGTLLFWPKNLPSTQVRQILVEQCTGKGRNHSGLAMSVFENNNSNSDAILLPGDAKYSVIPRFCAGGAYLSAVVPHHGGKMASKSVVSCPTPMRNHARLVYSTGAGNSYGHPHSSTESQHQWAGWVAPPAPSSQVRYTFDRTLATLGHVQIGWDDPPVLTHIPCHGFCSLDPQQT